MKKVLPIIIIIALLAGGGYWYYNKQSPAETQTSSTNESSDSAPAVISEPEKSEPVASELEAEPADTESPIITENVIENDSQAENATAAQEDIDPSYNPAIWKVEHNGVTSYLFGSIHMGDQSMYPLPRKVTEAFSKADTLVVEIDITKINPMEIGPMIQKMAMTPGKSLKDQISDETAAKFDEYCSAPGRMCDMFANFEPWFVAMNLEAIEMANSGYLDTLGIDMHFLNEAKDKKEIVELESLESQLKMMDQMALHLQELMLIGTVTREDGGTERLVEAWKKGDVETFLAEEQLSAKEEGINEEDYAAFMNTFLYKRNEHMADGIAELLEQGKSVFAVVGAAHYGGDKSVNHYLEQQGYKVTRL